MMTRLQTMIRVLIEYGFWSAIMSGLWVVFRHETRLASIDFFEMWAILAFVFLLLNESAQKFKYGWAL